RRSGGRRRGRMGGDPWGRSAPAAPRYRRVRARPCARRRAMIARLNGELPPEFSRPVIDRAQPLRFRLNGRPITGFMGDTVLSALLASGIGTTGMLAGSPLALDEHTAPAIALAGNEERTDPAMPAVLCPAVNGASFVTLGPRPGAPASLLSRLLMRRRNSLGLLYRSGSAEPGGWIDTPAARHVAVDV